MSGGSVAHRSRHDQAAPTRSPTSGQTAAARYDLWDSSAAETRVSCQKIGGHTTIGTWQEGQQSGPRAVLDAERAWAILLGIREHTRRFGRSAGDLSVTLRQDGH